MSGARPGCTRTTARRKSSFYDLRAMNGPTGGNFAKFYEELGRYIEAEMAPGAEERRATGQGELEGQGYGFQITSN